MRIVLAATQLIIVVDCTCIRCGLRLIENASLILALEMRHYLRRVCPTSAVVCRACIDVLEHHVVLLLIWLLINENFFHVTCFASVKVHRGASCVIFVRTCQDVIVVSHLCLKRADLAT